MSISSRASTGAIVVAALLVVGCVTEDAQTGRTKWHDGQYYPYETVKHRARELRAGMDGIEVLSLIGSPAERSDDHSVWVYREDRPGVLVPGKALRLEFERDRLARWEYATVVLGQDL